MVRRSSFKNTYRGIYKPQYPEKWINSKIQYLSLWERKVFKFLESHANVKKIGSETVIIPYYDTTTDKDRRYFMDIELYMKSGKKYLIEIKPYKQTVPPELRNKKGIRKSVRITETILYQKNICKWKSAKKYAKDQGFIFEIWTEHKLNEFGLKI